jgi:enoyl-CoA hydratase/carnithine racemase
MMEETTVLCEEKDGVAELTLNRPERMNAFTPQMAAELIQAFRRLDEDDSVRVIVVTGAGRAFCAGADLGGGGETFAGRETVEREQVLPRAREIARYIVEKCAPASVALTKRFIWEHLNAHDPLAVSEREARGMARLGRMPDAAEGILAFVQKRRPEWKLKPSDAPDVD